MNTLEINEQKDTRSAEAIEISGSKAVLEALLQENVDTVFGYPEEQLCLFMMLYTIIPKN
jgi:acetolactate synthase-1/2/3 large subunit